MGKFLALTRRETKGILLNPPILFATAFFVLLDSFVFYLTTLRQGGAHAVFDEMALFMLFTSIIMFPLISMHSFSEDNARGTLETLMTAPIGSLTAVLAKFSGAMAFVLLYLSHGLVYMVLLAYGGNLDWNAAMAAFLALIATGAVAMSLGVFVSSLTVSGVAAAGGTGGILVFMAVCADVDPYTGRVANLLNSLSFIPHAKRWIAGELDTRGLVYFLSVTALFLFYAWLSVGARGMERRVSNPVARRRLRVTYLLVSVGAVLLLTQAAILHIRGFWEGGTPLGPALSRVPWRLLLPLALSLGAFLWSTLTYRSARRAERGGRARSGGKYATISETRVMRAPRYYFEENVLARRRVAIAAVAALVVVVNLNWLAHYPFRTFAGSGTLGFLSALQDRRWDVSQEGRNSLSPTTRKTLDAMQGRVLVYSFLQAGIEAQGVPVADEMRRLLERYSDYNGLVTVTRADSRAEPELAAELANEIELPPEGVENLIVVDYQGRRQGIPIAALVAPPDWRAQMAGETKWVFDGENRLTQTLMRLADPRMPNVYFTYGHLELNMAGGVYPERSASRLVRLLSSANMRVRQHIISPRQPIPPDCEMLVVAAPRVMFQRHEVDELRRYLDSGGRLLLLAPPPSEEYVALDDPLNELAFAVGGGYRDDIIQDESRNDNGQALAPLGLPRGAGSESVAFVFPFSRSIRDNPRAAENGWTSERMMETHPSAVSVSVAGGEMRPGPFTLVYRSAKDGVSREARVVTVASGRMASDSEITRGANEALLAGLAQWLVGRETPTDIAPRTWVDRRLNLTGPQLRGILWIGVIGLPLAWILAGISVWWLRRE